MSDLIESAAAHRYTGPDILERLLVPRLATVECMALVAAADQGFIQLKL